MNLRVNDSQLTGIADAIRTKSGGSSNLTFPDGFVSEVGSIKKIKATTKTYTFYLSNEAGELSPGRFLLLQTFSSLYEVLKEYSGKTGTMYIQINKVWLPNTGNNVVCGMRIYGTDNITLYALHTGSSSSSAQYISAHQQCSISYSVIYEE